LFVLDLTLVSARLPCVLTAILMCASSVAAQSTSTDTRAQYPRVLANSYVSFDAGAVDYLFSPEQLQAGFSTGTIDTPHLTVRVALLGHEFSRFLSVQGAYMRPIKYVAYRNVNGALGTDHHHVRVNFGSVTAKVNLPVTKRLGAYGESGLAITSRTGFSIAGTSAVTDAHYPSLLLGGGVDYHLNRNWDATAGMTYTPGHPAAAQERTIFTSAGFRYTMRSLTAEQVAANSEDGVLFPRQMFQIEYSTGIGYDVNDFLSKTVPIFWGGNAKVDVGVAPHYERNVFHTRRLFSLDIGASTGIYTTKQRDNRFYTASLYPLFRFTFLRAHSADVYFAYSAAGPTFISRVQLDDLDTGRHFTFQDFMSLGVFAGRNRHVNVGIKINHFSNGNIFTQNAGVTIPLTVSVGYAF
jgi:opacity protein-like surface antigen